jgi:uncharacterized 2Fe-2S/4Fe-4S cluster protein (DUF4445 family)
VTKSETSTWSAYPRGERVEIRAGESLLECMQRLGWTVSAPCGGRGLCGRCRVRWLSTAPSPTALECLRLTSEERVAGWRLSCQHAPRALDWIDVIGAADRSSQAKSRIPVRGHVRVPRVQWVHLSTHDRGKHPAASIRADVEAAWGRSLVWREGLDGGGLKEPAAEANRDEDTAVYIMHGTVLGMACVGEPVYGIALDVGTTTVAGYLVDLRTQAVAAARAVVNSQSSYGADVMTRIRHASVAAGRRALHECTKADVRHLVEELCGEVGAPPARVLLGWVVGNPAMMHLAFDLDPASLGHAPFAPRVRGGLSIPATRLGLAIAEGAMLATAPSIGGFVGADAVAACVAAEVTESAQTSLLLDLGTNAEMALCHRGRILACSAAAGPAFEAVGVSCGVPAQRGAICSILGGDPVDWRTIDDAPAVGLCGTGLIDLVALLLQADLLRPDGRLCPDPVSPEPMRGLTVTEQGAYLTSTSVPVGLTQQDIRTLQLAAAALRAALTSLLAEAGLNLDEVERVVITGSFGASLRVESLITLGVLPAAWERRTELWPNAAGEGAVLCLLDEACIQRAERIASRAEHVELETLKGFRDRYLGALSFPDRSTDEVAGNESGT